MVNILLPYWSSSAFHFHWHKKVSPNLSISLITPRHSNQTYATGWNMEWNMNCYFLDPVAAGSGKKWALNKRK
jgi:hypothetical protein